jgi:GH25 family lysozyme M1 (1,4-beta-N-acetylmuramidase)
MTAYTLGADISHYENRPSIPQLIDDGVRFLGIKGWQGNSPDPDFEWSRQQAEANNLPWCAYIFDMATDTEASVGAFVAELTKGDVAFLDWEQTGVDSAVIEMAINVLDAAGMNSLVYRGKWPPGTVTPLIASKPWYYAQYPSLPSDLPAIPLWDGTGVPDWTTECLIWQFTGAGRLPGITTAIDLDRILMPLDAFTQAWKTGVWKGPGEKKHKHWQPAQTHPQAQFSGALLQLNSSGADVALLQTRLNAGSPTPNPQLVVDSIFGPSTLAVLKRFQAAHGLTADGIAGPLTLKVLS